ncbi:YwqG family protein [Streptomyces sp. NBC_01220]|uniref:DUF1963 domain-containing protein n=1 Tax=unclassified Streptomyces TaxID=2593676 RepID=UPI002E324056|nr:DUF1963 domain-containing protein [Streptomyces sp. NBC_01358]WSQ49076.1 YwqG family protein [Streptomyces sp. NBC_01220]
MPLPLLLSVDCGALPGVDGFGLPADGTLHFFVDQEKDHEDSSGRYARVVYVPDGTETALAEAPAPRVSASSSTSAPSSEPNCPSGSRRATRTRSGTSSGRISSGRTCRRSSSSCSGTWSATCRTWRNSGLWPTISGRPTPPPSWAGMPMKR